MRIRFLPSDSDKVVATFGVIFDEMPLGLMVGGGYLAKDKAGKVQANLNPPFARNAGIVCTSILAETEDGDTVSVQSKKGKEAAEQLKTRIAALWDGYYTEHGV